MPSFDLVRSDFLIGHSETGLPLSSSVLCAVSNRVCKHGDQSRIFILLHWKHFLWPVSEAFCGPGPLYISCFIEFAFALWFLVTLAVFHALEYALHYFIVVSFKYYSSFCPGNSLSPYQINPAIRYQLIHQFHFFPMAQFLLQFILFVPNHLIFASLNAVAICYLLFIPIGPWSIWYFNLWKISWISSGSWFHGFVENSLLT